MWVTKLLISPVKKRIFCPKTTKFGIFGHFGPGLTGYFGALSVGWLVVVARGLYLARHLSNLCSFSMLCSLQNKDNTRQELIRYKNVGKQRYTIE